MGCAASKLDIENERRMSLGLKPIRIKKYRRRRSARYSSISTTELLQSEESDNTGDTSSSGKVKASAVAPEPIAEEEAGAEAEADDQEECMEREELEENKEPMENTEDLEEKVEELKEKLEEKNQRIEELKEQTEEPEEENKEKPEDEREATSSRRREELEEDREEPKEEKEESIQWRIEEMEEKEKESTRQMRIAGLMDSSEEVKEKKEQVMERTEEEEEEDGRKLTSKRTGETENEFHGSPSFRFYCHNTQSFDSDDSVVLSGFNRLTEKLEETKQRYEPIEELSDSQGSSKGSQCKTPKKGKGRRLLKLNKAPNAVRNLFTCYSGANYNNSSSVSTSNQQTNLGLVGKYL